MEAFTLTAPDGCIAMYKPMTLYMAIHGYTLIYFRIFAIYFMLMLCGERLARRDRRMLSVEYSHQAGHRFSRQCGHSLALQPGQLSHARTALHYGGGRVRRRHKLQVMIHLVLIAGQ